MKVKLAYTISDNGDGSASINFFRTFEEAKLLDEYNQNQYGGFAEEEAFIETLEFDEEGLLINYMIPEGCCDECLEEFPISDLIEKDGEYFCKDCDNASN